MAECEIIRRIGDGMVSDFGASSFFSESELGLDGIVGMYADCLYDMEEIKLKKYMEENYDDYAEFWRSKTGSYEAVKEDASSILIYIKECGKDDDYADFVLKNGKLWRIDRDDIRSRLLEEKILPALDEVRHSNVYIYRTRDHCALHVTRNFM